MHWLEVCIEPRAGKLDELCMLLEDLGVIGLVIEDGVDFENFLENNHRYWDYVDEDLLQQKRLQSAVKFFLTADEDGRIRYEQLKEDSKELTLKITSGIIKDEDWENNWMQYYKPISIGERLLIVPEWEEAPNNEDRLVLKLNPGLIFGTGSHPTTAMCLEELEKYAPSASAVLDLGCGSGILAIASLVMGAKLAYGYDIDPIAPDTAMANASYNDISDKSFIVRAGDILNDKALRDIIAAQKYDLITANIVADVIMLLASDAAAWLSQSGVFICSGIIEGRQKEVEKALNDAGMEIIRHRNREDWHCYTAVLK